MASRLTPFLIFGEFRFCFSPWSRAQAGPQSSVQPVGGQWPRRLGLRQGARAWNLEGDGAETWDFGQDRCALSAGESRRSIPSSALEVRVGCPLRGGGEGMKRQVQLSMISREHGRAAMWNEAAIPTLLAEASCAAIAPFLFRQYCPQSPPAGSSAGGGCGGGGCSSLGRGGDMKAATDCITEMLLSCR